jgi:UDP-N-acetylglucosamine 4,6-dehydratase/5-epimerase
MFSGNIVLITGGTGSFGNAVLDKLLNTDVKEIRIFSRDEKKQSDMKLKYNDKRIKFIIGDVRDFSSVYYASKDVDYIFHAAALKQVPTCELYPIEAAKTNILGSYNVINASIENNIRRVVFLSTDKAVYPINAMGMTKALMEKLATSKSREMNSTQTVFCCTRYGNVMCSRGSVIPLFIDQIKTGRPITITDPDMTRFLMSLEEAVELVLNAFNDGEQGDIWVQKAPASTIYDLAVALKELFNSKVEIKVIGVRHGEKKHETLVTKEEMLKTEDKGKYFRVKRDDVDIQYCENPINTKINLLSDADYTSENTKRLNVNEIKEKLLELDYVKEEIKSFKRS